MRHTSLYPGFSYILYHTADAISEITRPLGRMSKAVSLDNDESATAKRLYVNGKVSMGIFSQDHHHSGGTLPSFLVIYGENMFGNWVCYLA